MKSENFCLKTVIKELKFLKQLLLNGPLEKKDLLLLSNNLIEKIPDLCNAE